MGIGNDVQAPRVLIKGPDYHHSADGAIYCLIISSSEKWAAADMGSQSSRIAPIILMP
jgi:hypothetical protein